MLRALFSRIFPWFGGSHPVVGVIRLTGPIGATDGLRRSLSLATVAKQIEHAFSIGGLKAVALAINSPGGSPVQSALILRRIRDLAKEKDVPVVAFAEDVAASGGYMLALAGDEIYVHEASIVGSIGVVAGGFGFPDAIKKLGIERRLYTAGDRKAMLDPFSPEREEDVKRLGELQKDMHEYFKKMVRDRRGRRLKGARTKLFSGDVWLGSDAVKLGLADGIGDLRSVMRERFGKKVRLKVMQPRRSRLGMLFGMRGRETDRMPDGRLNLGLGEELLAAVEDRLMWSRWGL